MKQPRHLLALATTALISVSVQAQSPQQLADEAANAYSYGDYETARQHYQTLNQQVPSYENQYNLAVCYYKLGQYTQAKTLFTALHAADPEDDNVTLNLAFTEDKLGDTASAKARYNWLASAAISDTIALVAAKRAALLDHTTLPPITPKATPHTSHSHSDKMWMINATLAYGSDDNVISFIDETVVNEDNETETLSRASNGNHHFTEFTFTPIWYSSSDFQNNWVIDSTFFKSHYADASDYNIDVISIGARKNVGLGSKNTLYASTRIDHSTVGGEGYLATTTLELGNHYKPTQQTALKYGARIQQGSALHRRFTPFEGDTYRLFSDISYRLDQHRFQLRLQLDDEYKGSRGDYASAIDISHYSATRLGLTASWRYNANTWGTKLQYQLRDSDFAGPYVRFESLAEDDSCSSPIDIDTTRYCATHYERQDTRHTWSFSATKELNDTWYVEGELRQLDNRSTLDELSYDNTTMTLTLGLQL